MNNPDISKIIGEQWKAESDEQKKYWQGLAQVGDPLGPVLAVGVELCVVIVANMHASKRKRAITNSTPTTDTSLAASASLDRHS